MNHVELEGGFANAPDFGFTGTGRCWARFTLAVSDIQWDAKNRREVIGTTWVSVEAWGFLAEELMKADPVKGEKVHIVGKLTQSEYEKDGKVERKTRVALSTFQFTYRKDREPALV